MRSPSKTSLGPIPLLDGVSIEVSAIKGGGWITTFSRGDETVAEDQSPALPWLDRYGAGRLTKCLCDQIPLDKKTVKSSIQKIFDEIRASPDARALVSVPVAQVIGETVAVQIELADPPVYAIQLAGGRDLQFQNEELAEGRPGGLNKRWLATHPGNALDATGRDFREIRDYWFSIAERVEPTGTRSTWDLVAEKLQTRLAHHSVGTDKDSLLTSGLFLEERPDKSTILWVAARIIESVLNEQGQKITDATFPAYLTREGILVGKSKRHRTVGGRVSAWAFDPSFRPGDIGITNLETLDVAEDQP